MRGIAAIVAGGLLAGLCISTGLPARAGGVDTADYTRLAQELQGRIGFERLPRAPEPGIALDAPIRANDAWLGERFAGQSRGTLHGRFDDVTGPPRAPLAIVAGATGENLSVAHHRGFGSNALFPVGPSGFPALDARGEGAAAVLFDQGQAAIGLRIHSDYPDPLGRRPAPPGQVRLLFYDRAGHLIAARGHPLKPGITELGFRHGEGLPDIAGVLILNDDPGGIAIDDILYQITAATG